MDKWLEYTGVAFGIIYILLATRGIVWCWPAGIISSVLYIFFNIQQHFYQDAILQVYYVLAGFYGWWHWHKKDLKQEENFISFSLEQNGVLFLLGVLLFPIFGYVFSKFGNSLSYFDAAVTVFSFIATWMTARKVLEGWLFWIAIDIVAMSMYFIKGAYPTTFLYFVYTVMPIYGYYEWRKQMRAA